MKWLLALFSRLRATHARMDPPHRWQYRDNPVREVDERYCFCGQIEHLIFGGSTLMSDEWEVVAVGDRRQHQAAGLRKVEEQPAEAATIARCENEPTA